MDEQEKLYSAQVPLLVHSDLRIVNDQGQCIHPSFFRYQHLNAEKNDYLSIALQNLVSGCALLVNRACVVSALPFPNDIVLHDWWLALIASRLGSISVTMQPCLAYRQHSSNVVGAKGYHTLIIDRLFKLFYSTDYDHWIGPSIRQLQSSNLIHPFSDRKVNNRIQLLTHKNPFIRLKSALQLRLSKHGFFRTISFYILLLIWDPHKHH